MLKLSIVALLAGLGMLIWLVASKLSSDAIGLALGVIFGVLAILPASMVTAVGRRREPDERIVYRVIEKPVYRVATLEPETPQLMDDLVDWDCLDAQAQVQLGVSQRRIEKRGKP